MSHGAFDPGSPAVLSAQGARHHVAITPSDGNDRLDKALACALPSLSRSRIRALIEAGLVSCDGRTVDDPSRRVKPGQSFDILVPYPTPAMPEPQAIDLVVVHEDRALLVVDKPAGMVVHPAAGNRDGTLVNALLAHCADELSGIGGVARPGIVHRLDKDTSGLMVVAKTDAAHAALAAQFAERTRSRTYLAVVRGAPSRAEGEVDLPIGRDPRNRKRMAAVRQGGKAAVTRYRIMRRFGPLDRPPLAALLECSLATGRTHQIRVHLAAIGHPVLGDPLYGGGRRGDALPGLSRQALHAARLRFVHPTTQEPVMYESGLPNDIKGLIDRLELLQ